MLLSKYMRESVSLHPPFCFFVVGCLWANTINYYFQSIRSLIYLILQCFTIWREGALDLRLDGIGNIKQIFTVFILYNISNLVIAFQHRTVAKLQSLVYPHSPCFYSLLSLPIFPDFLSNSTHAVVGNAFVIRGPGGVGGDIIIMWPRQTQILSSHIPTHRRRRRRCRWT